MTSLFKLPYLINKKITAVQPLATYLERSCLSNPVNNYNFIFYGKILGWQIMYVDHEDGKHGSVFYTNYWL